MKFRLSLSEDLVEIQTQDLEEVDGLSIDNLVSIYDEGVAEWEMSQRFQKVVSESELKRMNSERVPDNTRRSTKWAVKVWSNWANSQKEKVDTLLEKYKTIPELLNCPAEQLDFWLCRFIVEARKEDGKSYPTLLCVICLAVAPLLCMTQLVITLVTTLVMIYLIHILPHNFPLFEALPTSWDENSCI